MTFSTELKRAVGIVQEDTNKTWKKSVVTAYSQVINMTPVRDGFAKNSWLIGFQNDGSIGQSRLNVTEGDIPDLGQSVLLYSNIPYIELLEDGNWSDQAPNGMVKVVVASWTNIVESNRG